MNEIKILLSEFTELVNQRKTNKEIAEHYGISVQKVSQLKKEAGLRTPRVRKVTLVDDLTEDAPRERDEGDQMINGDYPIADYRIMDNYHDTQTFTAKINDINNFN